MSNSIGDNVKYYRERAGLTQKELAKLLHYGSHTSICKIELGERDLPISKIEEIARILGVSPIVFFSEPKKEGEFDEYIPYLAKASEDTIRTIRYMLKMPEKNLRGNGSYSEKIS